MSALAEYGISPVYTGQESHRLTTGGRVVALPGQHARLFSLNVTTAAANTIVYIYDGTSINGALIAQVDASSKGSFVFGGVRCPNGLFVNVLGGTIEGTLGFEGSVKDGVMTLSGNEIRDTTRALNTQGDGVTAPDSSMGIWEGTTNLVTNGGFETNTTGWAGNVGTETLARVTTQFKFGVASLRVVTLGLVAIEGAFFHKTGLTAGQTYVVSAWVNAPLGVTMTLDADPNDGTHNRTQFTGTGSWQKISALATSISGTVLDLTLTTSNLSPAQATTFYVDGGQVENKPIATPYVETNGASAARSDARVQAPSALLNATRGWAVARCSMGWASTTPPNSLPRVFEWSDGTNILGMRITTGDLNGHSQGAAGSDDVDLMSGQTWVVGDDVTLIFLWTSSLLSVSYNGSIFSSAARSHGVPAPTNATFDIGSSGTSFRILDSSIRWFACGTGALTNNDAAGIHAIGNTDPQFSNFPAAAAATMIWPANTAQFLVP